MTTFREMTFQTAANMAIPNGADWYSPAPLWQNGPTPGAFYNFPGTSSQLNTGAKKYTLSPMSTGTSVIGIQFKDGVIIAADTLASYGSLARYRNCQRVVKINDNIILGAGGDFADYQSMKSSIERKILEEECLDDGFILKPKALYCWLTRVMYIRRSKFDPLWNNFVIAGLDDGKPFLGTVDKLGMAYEDPVIATGFGAHLATPLMRKAYDENKEMDLEEAKALLHKAMQVLYYRDARSYPKYHLGIITQKDGVQIEGPLALDSNWEVAIL